jgi:hypothetical protein
VGAVYGAHVTSEVLVSHANAVLTDPERSPMTTNPLTQTGRARDRQMVAGDLDESIPLQGAGAGAGSE